jgi:hypothetical protein
VSWLPQSRNKIIKNSKLKQMALETTAEYQNLLTKIEQTYTQGRLRAVQSVQTHIIQTYWQVGQHIIEFEQGGKIKATYGKHS